MVAQHGAVFIHRAADGLVLNGGHVLAFRRHVDAHHPAGGVVQAFVHVHGAGDAIGAHHCYALQHVGTVVLHKGAGGRLHHAIEHAVGLFAGDHIRHLIVHAQQQGDHFAHAAAVQGRDLGRHRRAAQLVAGTGHGHRRGSAGAGRNCCDAACGAAGIDPYRLQTLTVIIHIVFVQFAGLRHLVVAVHAHRCKGQLSALRRHKGSLQAAEQHRGGVHLTICHGKAQGAAIGSAGGRVGREGIVQQHGAVLIVHGLALCPVQLAAQAQFLSLVQLRRREGTVQICHLVAQQLEHGRAGFFQRDGVVRAEGAVRVAVHPALLHRNADVGCPLRRAGHVLIQGAHSPLGGCALPVRRERHQHAGKGPAGDGGVQAAGLPGVHTAQRDGRLHGRVAGTAQRSRRHGQHGHRHAHRQQKCEKTFFHRYSPFFGLSRSAAPRWD